MAGQRQRCPDLALAHRTLDWVPATRLKDGLKQTIAYFERELAGQPGRVGAAIAARPDQAAIQVAAGLSAAPT